MKEYRQNSHAGSLIFWTVLCSATAAVLFVHSNQIVSRALRIEEILAGIALLIFGPLAFTVYLIRARKVWVGFRPDEGLVLGGNRLIPWDEIYRVERRRPVLRRSSGPVQISEVPSAATLGQGWGCADYGCLAGIGELFIGVLVLIAAVYLLWIIFFVLVPLLLLPLLEVFAPFGDRIKIHTRRGALVLRDLRDADEFMRQVSLRRPVTER
jgi:hypothetical protein